MRVVVAPATLKEVLPAREAAAALARGVRRAGHEPIEVPLADGGEGTADALHAARGGEWRTATVAGPLGDSVEARWLLLPGGEAVVEAAEAIGLGLVPPERRDPLRASSRGLGELILAAVEGGATSLLVALGGTATVDGGAGLREVVRSLPVPAVALADVRSPLLGPRGAARAFGPQKGAGPAAVEELEARLAATPGLAPFADVAGAGAAGGLGAAFLALGAELVGGARLVAEAAGLHEALRGAALAVTGEGQLDGTTLEGKAPAAVMEACRDAGVRCAVFAGRVRVRPGGVEVHALSGDPARAREDLEELGERLARAL